MRKKGKKSEEITESDRRNSKVCAFEPCEREENCGFVYVKSGNVPIGNNKERNSNHIYYSGDPESKTSKTAKKGKEYDGERGPLNRPEGHCQGSCEEGGEGSHEGAEKEEKEVEEMMSHLKPC